MNRERERPKLREAGMRAHLGCKEDPRDDEEVPQPQSHSGSREKPELLGTRAWRAPGSASSRRKPHRQHVYCAGTDLKERFSYVREFAGALLTDT